MTSEQNAWTRLNGPLSRPQSALVLTAALGSAAAVGVRTGRRSGWGRGLFLGAITVDLVGGLVSFQLEPTRLKYAQGSVRDRIGFALAHGQPFALPFTGQGSWRRAAARYATAVAATTALETWAADRTERRLIANAVAAAASLVDVATDDSPQRWFGPVFTMKLVGGHGGIPQRPDVIPS